MSSSPRQNIILIGLMGSGKSSIGRLVAQQVGFQFVDTDALIVEQTGLAIATIFTREGEEHFRGLETAALESLAARERCVVATGGGIILREKNRALLRELGFVVWLTASKEVLFERVSRNTRRPLLRTADPRATFAQLAAARQALYAEAAQCTLDSSTLPRAAVAAAVVAEARRAFSWQGPA